MVRVIASCLEFCALLSESEVLHRKVIIIFAIEKVIVEESYTFVRIEPFFYRMTLIVVVVLSFLLTSR